MARITVEHSDYNQGVRITSNTAIRVETYAHKNSGTNEMGYQSVSINANSTSNWINVNVYSYGRFNMTILDTTRQKMYDCTIVLEGNKVGGSGGDPTWTGYYIAKGIYTAITNPVISGSDRSFSFSFDTDITYNNSAYIPK